MLLVNCAQNTEGKPMIIIKKDLMNILIQHCQKEFPNEACGILAGNGERVAKAYEMINADSGPESFLMDTKEQLKVMKEIRSLGLEMLGIYHSHVASAAYPSSRDLELAFYPDASYVILALKDKNNPGIRSFKIKEGKISEEEVRIVEGQ